MVTIEREFCLQPKFLNENLKNHLYQSIKKELVGKCDQENGYILEVSEDITILNNQISPVGLGVNFRVSTEITTLKPEIGKKYTGKVCLFPKHGTGMLTLVDDKMKVFVPERNMDGYKYNKEKDVFEKQGKKKSLTIKVGDVVKLTIVSAKYEKQSFNCLGSLIFS